MLQNKIFNEREDFRNGRAFDETSLSRPVTKMPSLLEGGPTKATRRPNQRTSKLTALVRPRRARHERGSTNEEEVGQEAGEEVAVERERKRKKGGEGDADRAGEVSRGEKKREAASLWARAVDPFAEVFETVGSP